MRILLIFTLIFICGQVAWPQQEKTATQNSHSENLKELTSNIFKYPEFVDGRIILKDSSIIAARLNYNRVLGQMLFLSRQGKTLPLANPETIDKIIIGSDTFYFYNNGFLEKFTHYSNTNLYIKQTIKYIEKEKNGNTGSPSISTNSSRPYSNDDQIKQDIVIEKSALFKFIDEYFLADKQMNIYPVSKKSFYTVFSIYKNELKNYLQDHSVNFNNIGQVEKLLQYLQGL